jgi:hypothetical protein
MVTERFENLGSEKVHYNLVQVALGSYRGGLRTRLF